MESSTPAELLLPSADLPADMAFFTEMGFRLHTIYPDDAPEVAVMDGHGMRLRLDRKAQSAPVTLYLPAGEAPKFPEGKAQITAPNGTILRLQEPFVLRTPPTRHAFEVRQLRDRDPWVIGRAGMLYRDLVPGRLGGGIMASHIRIPEGGPVPDMVHYHMIGFQLIFCYRGWVRLVYEDQGPPFILEAGDCVTQPPEIRHRVLEASDNLEVIEIGVPAEHMTTIDHSLELPTPNFLPDREWQGQKFCRHIAKEAQWLPWEREGLAYRDTGIAAASGGAAGVIVARAEGPVADTGLHSHDADIYFTFVMEGDTTLCVEGEASQSLRKGEAFVIPPGLPYGFRDSSPGLELLEVRLPG